MFDDIEVKQVCFFMCYFMKKTVRKLLETSYRADCKIVANTKRKPA